MDALAGSGPATWPKPVTSKVAAISEQQGKAVRQVLGVGGTRGATQACTFPS